MPENGSIGTLLNQLLNRLKQNEKFNKSYKRYFQGWGPEKNILKEAYTSTSPLLELLLRQGHASVLAQKKVKTMGKGR